MRRTGLPILWLALALGSGCDRAPSPEALLEAQHRTEQARVETRRLQYKAAIEDALRKDAMTGTIADTLKRAASMRQIETSECPPDFRTAYLDHIYAWEYLAKVQRARTELASDGSVEDVLVRSIFASSNGSSETPIEDMLRLDGQLKQLEGAASEKISETFHAVERSAVSYGAVLPMAK